VKLPSLPTQRELEGFCREAAAVASLQPWTVEKDFYLTRLIWALAQVRGDALLLKGGTCLSKVDLGYHRMSEDIDLIVPGEPSPYKGENARPLNEVAATLREIGEVVGVTLVNFDGSRWERSSHAIWEVRYRSVFLPNASGVILVEVAIRPLLLAARRVALGQLLVGEVANEYREAYCWALDFREVCAEKVRAAFTREEPQIRDFYDLGLLAKAGADLMSEDFRCVVDAKLAELGAAPLEEQPRAFGLSAVRRAVLDANRRSLIGVVRIGEPEFGLQEVLDYYDRLWGKSDRQRRR
jgi:predicted nucleotidyltransferase component of viral defense system